MVFDLGNARLVAVREYMENIRTRGFWISILLMPVVLLVVSGGMIFVAGSEPRASFAVLDYSGWVTDAVRERVTRADLEETMNALVAARDELSSPLLIEVAEQAASDSREEFVQQAGALIRKLSSEGLRINNPTALEERFASFWFDEGDQIARLAPRVSFASYRLVPTPGADRASLNRLVEREKLLGYFVIPDDPVASGAGAQYVSQKLTSLSLEQWYSRQVTAVVRSQRIREQGIDDDTAGWITAPVAFTSIRLTESGDQAEVELSDWITQWAPVAFVYFLWISIFAVTQMLLTNTVEEKSNRLVEVLLSSISAVDLMAGKILGIAVTGLTIVGTWLAVFLITATVLPGVLNAPAAVDFSGLAQNPIYLISFLVYFLLGYFFYAAVLCGLGSFANNLKEAQNLMIPVQLCLFVPLMIMIPIGRDPNGLLAEVMTWIPPFTPFVMMNRAAFPPGMWTYVFTTVLMLVSIYVALRLAARVFESGMLMTGQGPRLRQMLSMLRRGRH